MSEQIHMKVGCPTCGASSNERCWNDAWAREVPPHTARRRLATTTPAPTPAHPSEEADRG